MIGQNVLVTGGTGSFGVALIGALLARPDGPAQIVSVSRNAAKRYELEQRYPDPRLIVVPGDVRIDSDLTAAVNGRMIDIIIHAAAEKHVPTGEHHREYVWSTNVDGAAHVIALARRCGAQRVVALSTDKACDPINAYGESKREAERLFLAADDDPYDRCRYTIVRYGNVCGSSGSVMPLFVRQRAAGVLTVTDRRMSRYFMSLSDDSDIGVYQEPRGVRVWSAVGFVAWALAHMNGGEIFVPRLPSATILDLAESMAQGATVIETGIRPGEKLHEDLISASEAERCYDTGAEVYAILSADRQPRPGWVRVPHGWRYHSGQYPQPIRYEVHA